MRIIIALALLGLLETVCAREVDHYLAWGVDLEDSGPAIDAYMRQKMSAAVPAVNARKYDLPPARGSVVEAEVAAWFDSCHDTAVELMREAFYSPTYQKIEKYVDEGNGLDIYPRRPSSKNAEARAQRGEIPANGYMTDQEYLEASIVQSSPMNVPLSRIVNIYGVYSGADKLGHFTSFGVRYLGGFVDLLESDTDVADAFIEVMDTGYRSEESIVGMLFTKVFSRGDLEANYQGMRFAWSLCKDESTVRLVSDGDRWQLLNVDRFSIRDYVNPNWDESYNHSIFETDRWTQAVLPTFEARGDCEKLESDWVRRQRADYAKTVEESPSQVYGNAWIAENMPDQPVEMYSLDAYCRFRKPPAPED